MEYLTLINNFLNTPHVIYWVTALICMWALCGCPINKQDLKELFKLTK